MLSSSDLRRFTMTPMRGPGARNKGIALLPRTVGGRHLALSRSDGKTIGLITVPALNTTRTMCGTTKAATAPDSMPAETCSAPPSVRLFRAEDLAPRPRRPIRVMGG
jgi:hypothetical protein